MKYRKHLVICIVAAAIGLSACGTTKTEDKYAIHTPDPAFFSSYSDAYENGMVYINANDIAAYFLDYTSFVGAPLCNKPNCTHAQNDCIAKLVTNFGDTTTPPVIYQDNVYYFTESDDIVTSEDGRDTSYAIECKLHKVDISNGEQTTVCTFDGMEATRTSGVYLDNGVLYFIANNGSIQDSRGAWSYFSTAGIQYMCSVDLNSGTFTNYGQINDTEKAATTLFCKDNTAYGINGDVKTLGVYDGKIWMSYSYADSVDALYDVFVSTGDFPDSSTSVWHNEAVTFDLSTKELSVSSEPLASCIGEDTYIYWDSDQKQYIARKKDGEKAMAGFSKNQTSLLHVIHDLVYDEYHPTTCYDFAANTVKTIADPYCDKGIQILAYENQKYVIQYYDAETDTMVFKDVPKSELLGE